MDTPKKAERGSAKVFAIHAHDHEGMSAALGIARSTYEVKWWWKYGQPAIDLIRASLEVKGEQLGSTIASLMHLNGPEVQVTAGCFPYGIPVPDVFRLELEIRKGGG
jgi:hypothetical protein